ncbi:MAG TPA: glycosyltransferase family 2 protein [Arsenicitalea sp.]|nr:glycosyltransferase family 2 protein [Arsenicitalea sp.]
MTGAPTISDHPHISVVIPHLNEPEDLRRCLDALAAQRDDGVPFEIIVVDNGSREPPVAVCSAFDGVRLEQELMPGPGPARNRGASVARGDIIAFIDADCLAQAGWVKGIADHFEADPDAEILAGDVGVARADPGRPTALEIYESIYSYRVRLYVERDNYAATGNMAVRKDVFEAVGRFGGIATMEDKEWGQRAVALGFRLAFAPQVKVLTPACKTLTELAVRWDRHIAHDFGEISQRRGGMLRWTLLSLAVAASPLAEAGKLAISGRGYGFGERLGALRCLTAIRLHRARKMVSLLGNDRAAQMVGSWNRD